MNLPNILTLLRVVMIPLFVAAFLTGGISDWITLALFALASITDALDGYIARKQNLVTDFGKLMDPLADKLMVMAAFVCFTYAGLLHPAITFPFEVASILTPVTRNSLDIIIMVTAG